MTRFSTRRPEFAANDNLWQLLTEKNVQVCAEPPPGPSLLERLLLGFGPTLLLVGLFVLLARRASGGRRWGRWAASAAPGPAATSPRPAGAPPSRMWPASTRSRTRSPRSSTSCATPTATGGWGRWSQRACCWPGRPGLARPCSPARSPARPTCPSTSSRPRSSSSSSWAWAPHGSGTCSRRPRPTPRRSSSSTSWTRSAAPAAGPSASAATTSASRPSTRS